MQTESPQPEPTDLGKDVERAIEEFWLNCQQHGDPKKLAMIDCGPCKIALDILKNAIRARIEEPGPEPSFEGTPLPTHQCWCKDTHMNHRDCKRRGHHRCGCGAIYCFRGPGWEGGLAGKPVRTQQVPAQRFEFVDEATEPLPQHIFERQHVGERELADRRGAFPCTSKHSLDWLIDTSPENLLKLERLSNTVYVLLGHRDPDRLAAWINRAHHIANEAASL